MAGRENSSRGGRGGGKKVGFASNLTSFENQSPSNERQLWDSETDHILSYFLGGDTHMAGSIPEFSNADPGTGVQPPPPPGAGMAHPAGAHPGMVFPPYPPPGNPVAADQKPAAIGLPLNPSEEEEDEPMAPPTPKLPQFFARPPSDHLMQPPGQGTGRVRTSPHLSGANTLTRGASSMSNLDLSGHQIPPPPQSAIPSSGSSSSSSLSTMANTLVSGGPMLFQQMQQQQHHQQQQQQRQQQQQQRQQQQQAYAAMMGQVVPSPVSPAALIGTPENLMLPPPPGQPHGMMGHAYQTAASEAAAAASHHGAIPAQQQQPHPTSSPNSQQQHMAWLRGLNALAKAGGQPGQPDSGSSQQQQPPPPAAPPPLGGQQPAPGAMPQGIPVHPGAAAAQFGGAGGVPFASFPPHMTFYGHAAVAAAAAMQQSKNPAPEESEEKRAKRLERNRESARKSRRRKKERLVTVEAQAAKMHQKIAKEREIQIEKLVPGLRKHRNQQLQAFLEQGATMTASHRDRAAVMTVVRETGPHSPIFQAVLEFQFLSLQANLLPRYQKFWLWLALNQEAFFAAGKEEFVRKDPDRMVVRTSSGKISSKQVGDELVNGPPPSDSNKRPAGRSNKPVDDSARTSIAHDAARMWPLTCYEHQFSVDQEEKFLALHKQVRQQSDVKESWDKSLAAVKAASSLRDAVEFVCKQGSHREERTLVGVLRVDQILKYRQWIVMNHERCSRSLRNRQQQQLQQQEQQQQQAGNPTGAGTTSPAEAAAAAMSATAPPSQQESLQDICQRLERVLRISKTDRSSDKSSPA